jgi:hypothetical protein
MKKSANSFSQLVSNLVNPLILDLSNNDSKSSPSPAGESAYWRD